VTDVFADDIWSTDIIHRLAGLVELVLVGRHTTDGQQQQQRPCIILQLKTHLVSLLRLIISQVYRRTDHNTTAISLLRAILSTYFFKKNPAFNQSSLVFPLSILLTICFKIFFYSIYLFVIHALTASVRFYHVHVAALNSPNGADVPLRTYSTATLHAIGLSRCAAGRSLVSATIDRWRCDTNRHKLDRWRWLTDE